MSERRGQVGEAFRACAAEGRAALVVYTTAGHPEPDSALETLVALTDAGVDVLELGVPFSDPLADGPTIQKASYDAIGRGVDLAWTLELLRRFRAVRETPVVLFSYLNPLLHFGIDRFIGAATQAGGDGVLLTDLPLDADPALERSFETSTLDLVRLIAPTTAPGRAVRIAGRSQGFVYYISRTGVTGASAELAGGLAGEVAALRAASSLPVAVGFGISSGEQAAAVASLADGVVVGSAVVEALGRDLSEAVAFVAELSTAVASPAARR